MIAAGLIVLAEGTASLSAEAFRAETEGFSIYYRQYGRLVGAEQYLPNNRVRWMAPDGSCVDGTWWEENGALCFLYEYSDTPGCWYVSRLPDGGLHAHLIDQTFESGYSEEARVDKPLPCAAPDLGV